MGAGASCPTNFERGIGSMCRHTCPPGLKYLQERNGAREFCVSQYNNDLRVELKKIPMPMRGQASPDFATERARVMAEYDRIRKQAAKQQPVYDALLDERAQMAANVQAYSDIRSQLAQVTESYENPPQSVKDLVDTLKPLRPPTAPAADLAAEHKAILESSQPNFLLIQVELAVVILCLLTYLFVPIEYAHGVAVILLSVGIAVGIFLWK